MRNYLILFFVLGVIFKLWFAGLVPQPFVFDQTEYHNFAIQMLLRGLVAWQSRLYGYPLFLAIIYKFFGTGNFFAVAFFQAILDCLTGVLIYLTAKNIFKREIIAVISYLLYLFNPFTSVFVVLALSEIFGIFLVALITYLLLEFAEVGMLFSAPPSSSTPSPPVQSWYSVFFGRAQKAYPSRKLFLAVLLLGFLPQVRPAFMFYSVVILLWLVIKQRRVLEWAVMIALFVLPFTYNIVGNWVYFRQFSPTTVDNLFVREFYISLYVPGRSPFHAKEPVVFPREVQNIYNEYTPVPKNSPERKMMANKYLYLGLKKVDSDPINFLFSRLGKFWYVWEKHFLFYYTQPENAFADFLTYWGNNLLLFLGAIGFIIWQGSEKEKKYFWFKIFVIFTVLYISGVHSFSLAEERYSLPGYPLVFLFAGYGVWNIISKLLLVIS